MTLLLCSFVFVEGKTRRSGENNGRAVSDGGSLRRALGSAKPHFNQQRHLKNNMKNHNKK
jgi:ABC-type molybdate transport system substrate-binding protein